MLLSSSPLSLSVSPFTVILQQQPRQQPTVCLYDCNRMHTSMQAVLPYLVSLLIHLLQPASSARVAVPSLLPYLLLDQRLCPASPLTAAASLTLSLKLSADPQAREDLLLKISWTGCTDTSTFSSKWMMCRYKCSRRREEEEADSAVTEWSNKSGIRRNFDAEKRSCLTA